MKTVVEVLGPEANLILAADIPGDSRLALLEMLSEAYAIEGLYVEACKCAQTILRLTSKEDPEESDYLAKIFAYTVQGSVMRLLGQAQLAIDCYEKAAQPILDGDCRTPDSLYKRVFIPLAEVHGENGNTQEMLDAYRECDLTIESDSQAPDKILFKIQKEASKAFFVLQYGLETDAAESAKSAWAQWVKYRDMSEALENIPEIIGSLEILGFNSMLTADYEFAGQAYQQALSMAGKRSSRSDYHLLAHLNYAQGVAKLMLSKRAGDLHTADMQEVVDLFREAVRCQVLTGDVSGPEYPEYCFYYGWAFMSLGKEDY